MRRQRGFHELVVLLLAAGGWMCCAAVAAAQASPAPKPDAPAPHNLSASSELHEPVREGGHRFWDKENDWLFAGVGASRTLDYFSTLNMRRRGRQEILLTNDVVDNHAAFAAIEASATAVSIGGAYIFHRYGHHKLERWTSVVHIGLTTTGAVRNYCLKTAHPVEAPKPTVKLAARCGDNRPCGYLAFIHQLTPCARALGAAYSRRVRPWSVTRGLFGNVVCEEV